MHKRCPYNMQPGVLLAQLILLCYFYSVPHRVVSVQPGIRHSNTLIFQIVQYTEYHCIRVQEIPAYHELPVLKTNLFSFQFYTIVIQYRNFNIGSFEIHHLYQLIEKAMGIYRNFDIFHSLLNLSFSIMFQNAKLLMKF